MLLQLEGDGPLSQRLYRGLCTAIRTGRLAPRTRLPSTRVLARQLRVSRNIVMLAFEQLRAEGYVESAVGSGTFVAASLPDDALAAWRRAPAVSPASTPGGHVSAYARALVERRPFPPAGSAHADRTLRYNFRYGVPSMADFPHAVWSRLVTRRVRGMTLRSLRYGAARGHERLRDEITSYLRSSRGVVTDADQVIVVSGTQQALDIVARLAIDPGERVVVEEPSYGAARQVFLGAGATLVPTPVDDEGLIVEALPAGPVRLAYVTPSHQFPRGGIMPLERRRALLAWAARADAYVLEDDYDSEFRYEGAPAEAVQALDGGVRVLYTGTFSKVLFPSLRLGYLVLPKALAPTAAAIKYVMDYHSPTFEQEVLADFIRDGHFERHLRRTRQRNLARRAALLEALDDAFGEDAVVCGGAAGIHVLVHMRAIDPDAAPALVARAAAQGLGIYLATPYYVDPPRRTELLFGYACLEEKQIRAGIRLLATIMR